MRFENRVSLKRMPVSTNENFTPGDVEPAHFLYLAGYRVFSLL